MQGRSCINCMLIKNKRSAIIKMDTLKIYKILVAGCYRILEGNTTIFLIELHLIKT